MFSLLGSPYSAKLWKPTLILLSEKFWCVLTSRPNSFCYVLGGQLNSVLGETLVCPHLLVHLILSSHGRSSLFWCIYCLLGFMVVLMVFNGLYMPWFLPYWPLFPCIPTNKSLVLRSQIMILLSWYCSKGSHKWGGGGGSYLNLNFLSHFFLFMFGLILGLLPLNLDLTPLDLPIGNQKICSELP